MVKVLFFSRGRAGADAVSAIELSRELAARAPELDVVFASHSAAAAVFRRNNVRLVDLALPEANHFLPTAERAIAAIRTHEADLVIAHEEPAAVFAAHTLNVPSIFMTAALPPPNTMPAEALQYCDSVVVTGYPGLFPVPPQLRSKPVYSGPLVRRMQFTRTDRESLRQDLGIGGTEFVVLVQSGPGSTELQVPVADLVLSAFYGMPAAARRLFWVSAKDGSELRAKCGRLREVQVLDAFDPIEKLIAVADVVVIKGAHSAIFEAAAVGTPSISFSGVGGVDDGYAARINTNVALNVNAVNAPLLASFMQAAKPGVFEPRHLPFDWSPATSVARAADCLLSALRRALAQRRRNGTSASGAVGAAARFPA